MDPILDMFSAAVLGLHVKFDATAEAKFELQSTIGESFDVERSFAQKSGSATGPRKTSIGSVLGSTNG